jgi:hypothetical protein
MVDEDGLPLVYDSELIQKYWDKEVSVGLRVLQKEYAWGVRWKLSTIA